MLSNLVGLATFLGVILLFGLPIIAFLSPKVEEDWSNYDDHEPVNYDGFNGL